MPEKPKIESIVKRYSSDERLALVKAKAENHSVKVLDPVKAEISAISLLESQPSPHPDKPQTRPKTYPVIKSKAKIKPKTKAITKVKKSTQKTIDRTKIEVKSPQTFLPQSMQQVLGKTPLKTGAS